MLYLETTRSSVVGNVAEDFPERFGLMESPREERSERVARHIRIGVPEESLGALIPRADAAVVAEFRDDFVVVARQEREVMHRRDHGLDALRLLRGPSRLDP